MISEADRPTQHSERMRQFWNERAAENAAWYVDTSLDYEQPDMDRFFETGRVVVDEALVHAPVQPQRREVALEIGCGLGRICAALSEHFDRVIGVDVDEEMLRQARELVASDRIDFRLGDGVGLRPVEDDSVDFVTSFTVLQHMPSRELVLDYVREAARVVRPGGVVGLQWNNLPHPRLWRARAAWWRARGRLGRPVTKEHTNEREFIGTRVPWAPVKETLESAGLEIRGRKGDDTLFSWVWAVKP